MHEEMHVITHQAPAGSVSPGIRVLPSEGERESTATAAQRKVTQQRIQALALRILVVDDEPTFRKALRFALETSYGAKVTEVPSGSDALQVELDDYDVILVDVKMPGMDGIVTCEEMLARGVTALIALMSTDSSHAGTASSHRVPFYDKNNPKAALEPILLSAGGGGDA